MEHFNTLWEKLQDKDRSEMESIASGYLDFLGNVKTESEAVDFFVERLEKNGFKDLETMDKLLPGAKFYVNHIGRALAAGIVGKNDIMNGLYVVASHIDSPRLDLKPRPVYDDYETNTALVKTQYYGGVKTYQWVNRPLALHGRIYTADGRRIDLRLGEDPKDPVLLIPDLLPHLSKLQEERKLMEGVEAEELNAILGTIPGKSKEEPFKEHVLKLLNQKYGINEEDLASAELCLVPAGKPREGGIDSSMIVGYGHDDKSCAYTSFRSFMDIKDPKDTAMVLFYDKEETGSAGSTGSQSNFIEYVVSLMGSKTKGNLNQIELLSILRKSKVISSDVGMAMDPSFKKAHDTHNAGRIGSGIIIMKYTGHGGKYDASEAPAEFVAYLRGILQKNNVGYQFGTYGKVDQGGGGTVAKFLARYGMSVVDAGAPVLGMHGPYEIVSKVDLWSCYRAYLAFMNH